jgi:hypothetical protein
LYLSSVLTGCLISLVFRYRGDAQTSARALVSDLQRRGRGCYPLSATTTPQIGEKLMNLAASSDFEAALRKLVACDFDHKGKQRAVLWSRAIQRGVTAMTRSSFNRKVLLLIAAVLASAAVAVSISLAYPTPVESPALGAEWQCHKAAIVTTCKRVSHAEPMIHHSHTQLMDTRRA